MSDTTVIATPDLELNFGDLSATVAAELATGLSSAESVRKRFGITPAQWKALTKNEYFRGMVRQAMKAFQGDLNAGRRITLKAEVLLEDSLADLYGLIKDGATPSGERIKAVQTMADLAGRTKKEGDTPGKGVGGFTLNINVGGDQPVVIQAASSGTSDV